MRTVRTSQPQQPTGIDWGNPITRGLVLALIPHSDVNLVSGRVLTKTLNSGGSQNTPSKSGVTASTIGTNVGRYYATNRTEDLYLRPEATLFCCGDTISTGVGDSNGRELFAVSAGTSTSNFQYASVLRVNPFTNQTGLLGNFRYAAYAGGSTLTAPSIFAGGRSFAVAQSYVKGARHALFSDGRVVASSVPANNNLDDGTLAATAVSAWSVATGSVNVALSLAFNRALSDAEIKSLSDNPWQIFQPTNRAIWTGYEAPAGGSPYTLTADTANVAVTGTDTTLAFNRTLVADAASLAVNGTATSFVFTRRLAADTGALAVNGTATGLAFNRRLIADTANVPTAGSAANLIATRRLTADTTNLAVTGNPATLTFTPVGGPTHTLTADTAGVAITGTTTGLAFNRKMVAEAYALAIAANDATLTCTPLTLPTLGRPASDTSNTGWTASSGSDLFAMIDEVTPSAADYISASSVGAVCQVALNTTAYPGTASQVLKYRASSSTGNSVIVRLKEGVTTIRAETQALTSVDTEYSITLTSGEIAAITSGALSVELESA